tara:strand:+ start:248 stop:424 length:177 start_codon:yes stop_codon:yes gene_type:complete
MKKIILTVSVGMAGVMSFFSPLTVSHGSGSCCAECVLKREDEIEYVEEDESIKNKEGK